MLPSFYFIVFRNQKWIWWEFWSYIGDFRKKLFYFPENHPPPFWFENKIKKISGKTHKVYCPFSYGDIARSPGISPINDRALRAEAPGISHKTRDSTILSPIVTICNNYLMSHI
jgi:hypothetical protein